MDPVSLGNIARNTSRSVQSTKGEGQRSRKRTAVTMDQSDKIHPVAGRKIWLTLYAVLIVFFLIPLYFDQVTLHIPFWVGAIWCAPATCVTMLFASHYYSEAFSLILFIFAPLFNACVFWPFLAFSLRPNLIFSKAILLLGFLSLLITFCYGALVAIVASGA